MRSLARRPLPLCALPVLVATSALTWSELAVSQPAAASSKQPSSEQPSSEQPSAPTPDPNTARITPPTLLQYQAAELPEHVEVKERTAVDLQLSIDAEGKVVEVTVLSETTSDLRRAAAQAAARFLFEPARADGTPIAVLIQYRYWFEPTSSPDEATAGSGAPLAESPQPTSPATDSDATADASSAAAKSPTTESPTTESPPAGAVPNGDAATTEDDEIYEAVAEVEAPPTEPTRRSLSGKALTTTAGTGGDPLRAIEVLPGVARSPDGGAPIIRGAAQHESTVLLDGTYIPLLFHFGAVTSVIHPRLIERVDLYPGNFSSRYGRTVGGIVEARLRAPKDEFSAVLDVNLIDSSVLVETPVSDDVGIALAARRSNIDFVFDNFVPEDAFSVVAAPLYWDYQAITQVDLGDDSHLRVAAFGARDELTLLFSDPSHADPGLRGQVGAGLEFHRLQVMHEMPLGVATQRAQVSLGLQALEQNIGAIGTAYFDIYEFDARAQWDIPLTRDAELLTGLDVTGQHLVGAYDGTVASASEGDYDYPDGSRANVVVDETAIDMLSPALYAEARLHATDRWMLIPGLRLDYYQQLGDATVNPRFSQRYSLTNSTVLKAGLGWYSQPPQYYEAFDPIGNPELQPYHSLHTSAGVEQRLFDAVDVELEAFYKHLYDRIVGTENGAPPTFVNDGRGRIYGMELGASVIDLHGFSGQLAYTLSRSERQDRDDAWRLFDQDQTHVLSLAAAYRLGAGWEASTRFRTVSGNPSTPVTGSVLDAGNGSYVPVFGGLNSERSPTFLQLDVRIQKAFRIGRGSLSVYADVQNVTNADNPEGYSYSYDYQTKESVSATPFFPNLGIRGEL